MEAHSSVFRSGIAATVLALSLLVSDADAATVGDEDRPALARATDGGFVAVWRRSPGGVRAQRYDAIGNAVGGEQVVSPNTSTDQDPAVTRLRDGRFLVVWRSGIGVAGRLLDNMGVPQGTAISISTSAGFGGVGVAINDKGRGLVTWVDDDGDSGGVFARRLRANGMPRDPSFRVNTHTTGGQFHPRVASVRPLRFVVVWSDFDDRDGSDAAVVAQRFNRVGTPIGSEFIVNSYATGAQRYPDVVRGQAREFVVVWEGGGYSETGPGGYVGFGARGIRARRFGPRGRKLGEELQVSTFEYGPHTTPSIDATDGGFVVVWGQGADYSYLSPFGPGCGAWPGYPQHRCQDGVGLGVIAQTLDVEGGKIGGERIVSQDFAQIDQHQGVVAALPPGRFVVAWTDAGCLTSENYNCRYFHDWSSVRTRTFESTPP